ncbi:MAG: rane protein of unknown function [Candidatus Saccharibacteria bacterium]|nr:rane protein of unknown function [Candidatus Saccharibacteria bacterium]
MSKITQFLADVVDPSQFQTELPQAHANSTAIHDVLQIVFGVLGALAVLMIVIAGLRFITAQGNPQETAKARSTIVYAIVGLLVALMAEAIVSFVLGSHGLGG